MVGGQASDGANNPGGAAVPGGSAGANNGLQNGGATANGAQGQSEFNRGLDSGLAKAAPSAVGLTGRHTDPTEGDLTCLADNVEDEVKE